MYLKKLNILCSNPIVKNMIGVWQEVRKYLKDPSSLFYFSPIWGNFFRPGIIDVGFKLWADRGAKQVKSIYGNDWNVLTFDVLLVQLYGASVYSMTFCSAGICTLLYHFTHFSVVKKLLLKKK